MQEPFQSPAYSDLARNSERELGAFISAVTELYGAEQARLSVIDWLDQFESINDVSGSTIHDWRLVTVRAAVCLVNRLRVKSPMSNTAAPPSDTNISAIPSSNCSALRHLM
jgi:hypothetical protein